MRCPNCSNEVVDGSAFCPYCGAQMNVAAPISYTAGGFDPNTYYDEEATLPFMPDISDIPSTEFCLKCGKAILRGQVCSCEGAAAGASAMGGASSYRAPDPGPVYRAPDPTPSVPTPSTPGHTSSAPSSAGKSFFKSVNKL